MVSQKTRNVVGCCERLRSILLKSCCFLAVGYRDYPYNLFGQVMETDMDRLITVLKSSLVSLASSSLINNKVLGVEALFAIKTRHGITNSFNLRDKISTVVKGVDSSKVSASEKNKEFDQFTGLLRSSIVSFCKTFELSDPAVNLDALIILHRADRCHLVVCLNEPLGPGSKPSENVTKNSADSVASSTKGSLSKPGERYSREADSGGRRSHDKASGDRHHGDMRAGDGRPREAEPADRRSLESGSRRHEHLSKDGTPTKRSESGRRDPSKPDSRAFGSGAGRGGHPPNSSGTRPGDSSQNKPGKDAVSGRDDRHRGRGQDGSKGDRPPRGEPQKEGRYSRGDRDRSRDLSNKDVDSSGRRRDESSSAGRQRRSRSRSPVKRRGSRERRRELPSEGGYHGSEPRASHSQRLRDAEEAVVEPYKPEPYVPPIDNAMMSNIKQITAELQRNIHHTQHPPVRPGEEAASGLEMADTRVVLPVHNQDYDEHYFQGQNTGPRQTADYSQNYQPNLYDKGMAPAPLHYNVSAPPPDTGDRSNNQGEVLNAFSPYPMMEVRPAPYSNQPPPPMGQTGFNMNAQQPGPNLPHGVVAHPPGNLVDVQSPYPQNVVYGNFHAPVSDSKMSQRNSGDGSRGASNRRPRDSIVVPLVNTSSSHNPSDRKDHSKRNRGSSYQHIDQPESTVGKLFIGNLDESVTPETLKRYFQNTGLTVKEVSLFTPRRSYGFVYMVSDKEADRAMDQFNKTTLNGRTIVVERSRPTHPDRPQHPDRTPHPDHTPNLDRSLHDPYQHQGDMNMYGTNWKANSDEECVLITGIGPNTSRANISDICERYGTARGMASQPATGNKLGSAVVRMSSGNEARKVASNLHKYRLHDYVLKVLYPFTEGDLKAAT